MVEPEDHPRAAKSLQEAPWTLPRPSERTFGASHRKQRANKQSVNCHFMDHFHSFFELARGLRAAVAYYIGGAGVEWLWPLLQLVAARRVTTL